LSRLLIFSALISVASCNAATEPSVGDEFVLTVGESVRVDGVDLAVEFVEVSEDSRCPSMVQCVWAGNGAVVVRTTTGVGAGPDTLHTNLEPRVIQLGNVQLELISLAPFPETPDPISTDFYRATFVTRFIR
jgi:hypothetical protein